MLQIQQEHKQYFEESSMMQQRQEGDNIGGKFTEDTTILGEQVRK